MAFGPQGRLSAPGSRHREHPSPGVQLQPKVSCRDPEDQAPHEKPSCQPSGKGGLPALAQQPGTRLHGWGQAWGGSHRRAGRRPGPCKAVRSSTTPSPASAMAACTFRPAFPGVPAAASRHRPILVGTSSLVRSKVVPTASSTMVGVKQHPGPSVPCRGAVPSSRTLAAGASAMCVCAHAYTRVFLALAPVAWSPSPQLAGSVRLHDWPELTIPPFFPNDQKPLVKCLWNTKCV